MNSLGLLSIFLSLFMTISRATSIYDVTVQDHAGEEVSLKKYVGKVTLIVNVASQCGYTEATYKALTRLHDILSYGKHFSVLAFPCNQFGDQEPLETEQILPQMQEAFGVEFPIFHKINVVGSDASPLFKALIDQSSVVPDWNFYKYLVDGEGVVLNVWGTSVTIEEIFDEIYEAVKQAERAGKGEQKEEKEEKKKEPVKEEL